MKDLAMSLIAYLLAHPDLVLGVVLSGLGGYVFVTDKRRRLVALAVYHGYTIAQDVDAEAPTDTGKKLEAALKAANDWMVAHGWRPLKPGEQAAAQLSLKALDVHADSQGVVVPRPA